MLRQCGAHTAKFLWLQFVMNELHVPFHTSMLLCDNLNVALLSYDPVLHACTKHIELDIHFV